MMRKIQLTSVMVAIFLLAGCKTTTTQNVNMNTGRSVAVKGLNHQDFQTAAKDSVDSMLKFGVLNKPDGSRYILAISDIINDTMQRIDTDQLIKKIRVALLQSGKVVVTTAVGANGAEDKMSMGARKLRINDEFNQKTVAAKGRMIAPDMSLSGKIIQKNIRISKDEEQMEYYFQLSLTDINTGLAVWEGETVLGKRTSSKSVGW
jgi:uncharacterized protein (TIGR02722 family)